MEKSDLLQATLLPGELSACHMEKHSWQHSLDGAIPGDSVLKSAISGATFWRRVFQRAYF